jgi:hypothetical protein
LSADQESQRQLSGIIMLILTDRELEFLASFNANWTRLYWNELARLQSRERLDPEQNGRILTLAPEYRECDKS